MHSLRIKPLSSVLLLGAILSSGHSGTAGSHDETKTTKSARGGALAKTARNQFEVFFYPNGLRVYPLDSAGSPIDPAKLTGSATFYHPNSPKPWFSRPLKGAATTAGAAPASIDLVVGMGTVPPTGAKVTFEIAGLPDATESTATFTVPVEFVKAPTAATLPVPPPGAVAPSPRYVYGPGYYGYGYYQYPGPEMAPAARSSPTVYGYSNQSGSSGGTHDWSTGRSLPSGGLIGKPWLRPMD